MGPTATGKTDLAIRIAQHYKGEVLNVDSAQVYRGMDIGTAKADLQTRSIVPHHLFDIREPHQAYSAADFYNDAIKTINEIHARGNLPILAGGTMLYFKALFEGLANLPAANEGLRKTLENRAKVIGWSGLHVQLERVDKKSAQRIKPNDKQRIQRALEVFYLTGSPISYFYEQQKNSPKQYQYVKFALIPKSRAQLHRNIAKRLNAMFENGFLEEVLSLKKAKNFSPDCAAMRAVGYRQILAHQMSDDTLQNAIDKTLYATRQLAKRQLTWLRKMDDIIKIDPFENDFERIKDLSNIYLLS